MPLVIVTTMMLFSACGSSSHSNTSKEITSEGEAIAIAKNEASWSIICDAGIKYSDGFKWGACTASKQSDGSWKVTLKGNVYGYADDYKNKYVAYTFDAQCVVTKTGSWTVRNINTRRQY